jgi:hypothetical protein
MVGFRPPGRPPGAYGYRELYRADLISRISQAPRLSVRICWDRRVYGGSQIGLAHGQRIEMRQT